MPDFQPEKLKPKQQFVFEGAWPTAIAFLGNDRLAAANRQGQIFIWDLSSDKSADNDDKAKKRRRG